MPTIIELCDNQLYVESERWRCSFGYGEPVKLGLVLEAVNMEGDGDDGFPFVVYASLIPQPEYLEGELVEEAISEGALCREEQIRYAYERHGGVPVNIDAVQPVKDFAGAEMEVRHFQDLEEAMNFARDFYAVYVPIIFSFIDVVLDNPLPSGGTGWDKIRLMAMKKLKPIL
jgi:hypothetical protein